MNDDSFEHDMTDNGTHREHASSSADDPSHSFTTTERDEVQEVRNGAKRDTFRVVMWRTIVTGVMLLTALVVTMITYKFLDRQLDDSFETQFEHFSKTLADAAVEQISQAVKAQWAFSRTISAYVETVDPEVWPLYHVPLISVYAADAIDIASIETAGIHVKVKGDEREAWEEFVELNHVAVMEEAHMITYGNLDHLADDANETFHNVIWSYDESGEAVTDPIRDEYWPSLDWGTAPITYGFVNWNIASSDIYSAIIDAMVTLGDEAMLTPIKPYEAAPGKIFSFEDHDKMHENLDIVGGSSDSPHAFYFVPIHKEATNISSEVVAFHIGPVAWDSFMTGLLPSGVNGIYVILENSCGQMYSFLVNGPRVQYLGEGDFHDRKYDGSETYQDLQEGTYSNPNFETQPGHCIYALRVYPSDSFKSTLDENTPKIFAAVVACFFVLVVAVFFIYDSFVQRRNEKLVANAARSNAIVASLFPSNVRDRLINRPAKDLRASSGAYNLKKYMSGDTTIPEVPDDSKPLADLFLESTVMFADIAGFTAWSSVREPSQVFTLLETLYGAFDYLAKVRRVLKVETVGDCYVAASGIPDVRKDHAVVMVRFARDILNKMNILTTELEVTLGPDTGDLSLRVGIHSGPVTGGVLRGDRSRFQLFGDTMNVCSRIESNGTPGRIHLSQEAAENLRTNGKGKWLIKREGTVQAKGKGELQTYWVATGIEREQGDTSSCSDEHAAIFEPVEIHKPIVSVDSKAQRLVDWNVEMLSQILRHVVAYRKTRISPESARGDDDDMVGHEIAVQTTLNPLSEVVEIIQLPAWRPSHEIDRGNVILDEEVSRQLREYCMQIASMYRGNWFHNFEHASHVAMSVVKLLSRIVAPTEAIDNVDALHDHTYGITSDPLTQFACAFAAMIHDVDHSGVPNSQLVKEGSPIAQLYGNRSVAEQNSVVLAWDLFMSDEFDLLRQTVCADEAELSRFRQLIVNTVMATDIVDRELIGLRNARWDKAFSETESTECLQDEVNRKATIVMEHLLQASDVAHTMQHWHVYRKWNELFFFECRAAYLNGRAQADPAETWYKGELGFFDFYVIPLAKKLKDCGVFGKSSDEYLTYALANRNEWERRGQEIVAEMLQACPKDDLVE
eukprot:Nitzschia sp. Nitz4//scaffold300_size22576//11739//15615//NITZ4_008544-RA/size22576-augustus-gene-0.9-mRNA-1//1//CDS//3329546985//6991//frame0